MPEISLPLLPAQEAIDYFLAKGFEPTFAWQDFYAEHHARDFTVAKMMRMDLLQTVHEHLTRAMTDGLSLQQFSERLRPILEKEGWWGVKAMEDPHTGATVAARLGSPQRLQIIYDTNLRTSYAVGRWRRGERNAAHQPLLLYRTMRDGRVRASHARYDGVTLPRTHVWWDTHYPPNGWRCRCLAYPISDDGVAELKKSGLEVKGEPPKEGTIEWTNPRTGETRRIPAGIDPGWDYHPGKAAQAHLLQAFRDKVQAADPALAKGAVRDLVVSEIFQRWYAQPEGVFPLVVISQEQADAIGTNRSIAVLSRDTAIKQRREHPDIQPAEYSLAQTVVDRGERIQDSPYSLIYILDDPDGYVLVVKATRTGQGLFVQSYRRLSQDEAKRDKEIGRLRKKPMEGGNG
jgi:hypothetical protein